MQNTRSKRKPEEQGDTLHKKSKGEGIQEEKTSGNKRGRNEEESKYRGLKRGRHSPDDERENKSLEEHRSKNEEIHEGDTVKFNIGKNTVTGTVTEVLTEPTKIGHRVAHASKEEPRFAVKYDATGTEMIRTEDSLQKVDETGKVISHETKHHGDIHRGDHVSLNIGQNQVEGTVTEVLTHPGMIGHRVAHATTQDPRFGIVTDSGAEVIRSEDTIEKLDDGGEQGSSHHRTVHTSHPHSSGSSGKIHQGDHVDVIIGQNLAEGTVTEVLTHPGVVGHRVAHGSKAEPRYAVEMDTGGEVIRTGQTIHKIPESSHHTQHHHHEDIHRGDHVNLNIGQNIVEGTVTDVLTHPGLVGNRVAHGSKDEPRLVIETDTGSEVLRTEDTVHKIANKNHGRKLEHGYIYFFYKPKVEVDTVTNFDQVQRLFIVLIPKGDENFVWEDTRDFTPQSGHKIRLLFIPKKKLPTTSLHQQFFGIVGSVQTDIESLKKQLEPTTYETQTLGERHLGGARPLGAGIYSIVTHNTHTHLLYTLEQFKPVNAIQQKFNIELEGSFVISIKNPEQPGTMPLKKPPGYPEKLQKLFKGRKWNTCEPTEFLDYPGTGVLFIGASSDVKGELGELGKHFLEIGEADMVRHIKTDDQLFIDLNLSKKDFPPEPLLRGKWA